MKTKTCFKCGRTLPITEFYTHPQMADGHLNKCKDCTKRDVADHKRTNPGSDFDARLRNCLDNPTQRNAYRVVEAAVASGRITKPTVCSGCGCPGSEHRIEAHHYDYSKPLEVIWLCTSCHARMDEQRRRREGKKAYQASKPVLQMKDGIVLERFESIADAAKAVGRASSSISQCLAGVSKTCAGFEWAHAEDNIDGVKETQKGLDY